MNELAATSAQFSLRNVCFSYADKLVLHDVSFEMPQGGYYVLKGPSGTGKSTLLRLLCKLEHCSSGSIWINGRRIQEIEGSLLRSKVVYLQQKPVLQEGDIRSNLLTPFRLGVHQSRNRPDDATLEGWLERLRLGDVKLTSEALSLSVGQQQRLCLIRALLVNPESLLLDEPISALDEESATAVMAEVERVNRELNVTVVCVTHQNTGAPLRARVVHMSNGAVQLT